MHEWEVNRADYFSCKRLETGSETERQNSLLLAKVGLVTDVEELPADGTHQ